MPEVEHVTLSHQQLPLLFLLPICGEADGELVGEIHPLHGAGHVGVVHLGEIVSDAFV